MIIACAYRGIIGLLKRELNGGFTRCFVPPFSSCFFFIDGIIVTRHLANGVAAENIGDSLWQPVTLNAGFTGNLKRRKIGDEVFLYGNVSRTAGIFPNAYTYITTLPEGWRPTESMTRFPLSGYQSTANQAMHAIINTDGSMGVFPTGASAADVVYFMCSFIAG